MTPADKTAWEIQSLVNHYNIRASTLIKILADFLDHTASREMYGASEQFVNYLKKALEGRPIRSRRT